MRIRVNLLGPLQVWADGREIEITRPSLRATLAVLGARLDTPTSIDVLVDQLWVESAPPASPSNAIHIRMTRLRELLGGHNINNGPSGYQLDVSRCTTDLAEWRELCIEGRRLLAHEPGEARKRLSRARELWRGEAFEGFEEIRDFEARRAELEVARQEALVDESTAHLAAGFHGAAIEVIRPVVASNERREDAVLVLMTALQEKGRSSEAVDIAQSHVSSLLDAGLDPTPRFRRAEQRLLANADVTVGDPTAPRSRVNSTQVMSWRPQREAEFVARISAILASAEPAQTTTLVIASPRQYGLSTFLRHTAAQLRVLDPAPHVVHFEAHGDAEPQSLQTASGSLANPLLTTQLQARDAAVVFVDRACSDQHAVLVVDDAHRLDEWSLAFLSELDRVGHAPGAGNLVIILGVHPRQSSDGRRTRSDFESPISAVPSLFLDRLSDDHPNSEVDQLVAAHMSRLRPFEQHALARRLSGFFDHPYWMHTALERIALLPGDVDVLDTSIADATPVEAAEVVLASLDELSRDEVDILEQCAVLGIEIDPLVVAAVVDTEIEDVVRCLGRAQSTRLVTPGRRPGSWTFSSGLVPVVLAKNRDSAEQAMLHRSAASWLQSKAADPVRIAQQVLGAGPFASLEEIESVSLEAGEVLLSRGSAAHASELFDRALESGASTEGALRAHLGLGRAAEAAGNQQDASAHFTSVIDLADPSVHRRYIAAAGLAGWGHASRIGGTPERRDRLAAALRRLGADEERDRLFAEYAFERTQACEELSASELGELSRLADDAGSPGRLLAWRLNLILEDNVYGANFADVRSLVDSALQLSGNETTLERAASLAAAIGIALRAGEWSVAGEWIAELERVGRLDGDPRSQWQHLAFSAALAEIRGHSDEANTTASDALECGLRLQIWNAEMTFGLLLGVRELLNCTYGTVAAAVIDQIDGGTAVETTSPNAVDPTTNGVAERPITDAMLGLAYVERGHEDKASELLAQAVSGLGASWDLFGPAAAGLATLLAARLRDADALSILEARLAALRCSWLFIGWGGPCLGPTDWYRGLCAQHRGDTAAAATALAAAADLANASRAKGWLGCRLVQELPA